MLSDGQSGAGGFFRVFDARGRIIEDVDTEEVDYNLTEAGDPEPLIALVSSVARRHNIDLVRDGALQDSPTDDGEPITIEAWAALVRAWEA